MFPRLERRRLLSYGMSLSRWRTACSPNRTRRFSSTISGRNDPFESLSKEIDDLTSQMRPTPEQLQEKDAFVDRLQRTIEPVLGGAVVSPFGSAMNGFWLPNSDIDVCIQIPSCRTRTLQVQALKKIASSLHAVSTHFIEPRFSARVPIIHWAPRRPGYLSCDISINNNLAVVNSRLVGTYCSIDPRMNILGLMIKHWANSRGINDRSRGTLSSFSLLLMLIHFLQHRVPPILPSLQDLALEQNEPLMYLDGADVRFTKDMSQIRREMHRITKGEPNVESVGSLFYEFFRFYGFQYRGGVIATRDLRLFRSMQTQTEEPREKEGYLIIDNPFEVGKDVANVYPGQLARIRQEFRRVKTIIDSAKNSGKGGVLAELCSKPQTNPTSHLKAGEHPLDPPLQSLGGPPSRSTKRRNS